MGIKSRFSNDVRMSESTMDRLYREERSYRADKLVEKWSKVPEIGRGLKDMDVVKARNTAIMLENQARVMSRMNEAQTAQMSMNFGDYTPENMLRLVRLTYPNSIREDLVNCFAMETARDSIKYIRPVYTRSQQGGDMKDRTFAAEGFNLEGADSFLADTYRKAMYESTESRYATELSNAVPTAEEGAVSLVFAGENTPFGAEGKAYIDGYSQIFMGNERTPLAIEDRDGNWFYGREVVVGDKAYKVTAVEAIAHGFKATIQAAPVTEGVVGSYVAATASELADVKAFGRFDSEQDLTGQYLGEVELVMTDYQFKPRPITMGVTWTELTELVLDTSFGISAEEMLMDSAAQEIKKTLDYQTVKYMDAVQKLYAKDNNVTFAADAGDKTDDSYFHTAQLIGQAIDRVADLQLNAIGRGGVSAIVGGPAAINYLKLNKGFRATGAQPAIGGHRIGTLDNIPIFKVPSGIIPDDELITSWKNSQSDADVSIAVGTLLPFYSTGVLQRKNLYKEAAIARFEDMQALQPKYLGRIKITGLRMIGTNA